ncbi:MAG TPA: metallophosphoesterase [Solirubrobacteraceae bacterium]|nr:metallophosphoesterase [Solirubrobacteraceae bacterium]
MTEITRREALARMLAGAALLAAGCGSEGSPAPAPSGSTLSSTWRDPGGTGGLSAGSGERLLARTELGPARPAAATLATLAHVTDAHVLDASSPARVTFLDRLGEPFQSTFRPQEALTAQVLAGAIRAIRSLRPDAVIQGGDLIDNDQANELTRALAVLGGGVVHPGSGPQGYFGVQSALNPDPFYYRPDLDAPRHRGLLGRAAAAFLSPGLRSRWYPVLGDHDILVAGEIAPTSQTRSLALGDEAVWELPPGLTLPSGASLTGGGSPDGPPSAGLVHQFLAQALAGPRVRVPPDPSRREMPATEVVARLRRASRVSPASAAALDYHADVGRHLRLVVLDLARRGGGSGGLVAPGQPAWLEQQLAAAGNRWVIIVSHQPIASSQGGDELLALLDQHPKVVAALSGHTHRNRIDPRPTPAGGYWLIQTASLVDYPQQARALRLVATAGGGVAVQTWMLDHTFPGDLGTISRQLAYLDAQGGRPGGFAGTRRDRNVTLFRAP